MPTNNDRTTLVCLFHEDSHARAALDDLYRAGVDRDSISAITGKDRNNSFYSNLQSLGVPARDLKHLQEGIAGGGTLLVVSAISKHVGTVERIFGEHMATKIDEAVRDAAPAPAAVAGTALAEDATVPVVEEELQVGKRTVDRGGVRVYRRVVEVPVEETVNLREEHVMVERHAVDRPATSADLAQANQSIELTETAEEAVVGKTAHVVEEVLVGKVAGQHIEQVRDTVRKTEVEIQELKPSDVPNRSN